MTTDNTDVTPVTRNGGLEELKVLFDLIGWIAMLYVVTHPDIFEKVGEIARHYWQRGLHHFSVWTARQDIRSLPETEE